MAYRSTEKTRAKKDAKRTAMMQAAVGVFAERGYHAATVRDIVKAAGVAIGTFYFYFPDKETLFVYLYEETADFLLQTLSQALGSQQALAEKVTSGIQQYVNVSVFEPAVIQLLLVGGVGAVPSLNEKRLQFRTKLVTTWQRALDHAVEAGELAVHDTRRSAEFIAGGCDEVLLSLLQFPDAAEQAEEAVASLTQLILNAVGYGART